MVTMNPGPFKKQKIVVLGTGLFVPEIVDIVAATGRYDVSAFVENRIREKTRDPLLGRPVIWIDDAKPLAETHKALRGLSTTRCGDFIERISGMGFEFATIIHPSSQISATSSVSEGVIVSAGVIIASNTTVGAHVILNRGVLVGHDTEIRGRATVSPGANIAGRVIVGEGAYIGMGAIILDSLTVGAQSVVGSGAVVTRDVPDRVQVVGIPARITKENIAGK